MDSHVVPDVFEMQGDALGDIDFANGDARFLHQAHGIMVGSVGGSEPRHRYAEDSLSVYLQLVKRANADQ